MPLDDDIPIAQREGPVTPRARRPTSSGNWTVGLVGLLIVAALVAIGAGLLIQSRLLDGRGSAPTSPSPNPMASESPTTSRSPASSSPTGATPENLLGHLPYPESPATELDPISNDGAMRLRSAAAKAFREMVEAAGAEGVTIVPVSAFRSIAEQQQVYFNLKAERRQTPTERAQVSAPPGYSEHHTGYAVDIGDGGVPAANLSPSFEGTPAFKWLQANSTRFNFELSFPKGNKQGVSYEPWHWRFVGDQKSLELFYKARNPQK